MTSLINEQQQSQSSSWSHQLNEDNDKSAVDNDMSGNNSTTPVRKRTRATADQLSVLEDTFAVNVSPNSKLRKQLAEQLQMSERSIQIWFQNRRAKVKHMQKRAQMQMHQASVRAQLYQYQQQQQQQHHQHQQQQQQQQQQQLYQHPYYYNRLAIPARAQSVDAVQQQQHHHFNSNTRLVQPHQDLFTPPSSVPPPPSYSATPPPMSYPQFFNHQQTQHQHAFGMPTSVPPDVLRLSRQSMPPQGYPHDIVDPASLTGVEFPEYVHGQISPSPSPLHQQQTKIPTLVSVPDAGPTAVLTISSPHHPSQSPNITTTTGVPTIDPSSLLIQSEEEKENVKDDKEDEESAAEQQTENEEPAITQEDNNEDEPKDLFLSATTLTIGTWHRLKMQETDLVCVYRPDTRIFAWHIVDGGCHFKMEVAQHAVSSIEFILDDHEALADVHFDISEPPLFYMESTTCATEKKAKKKSTEDATEQEEPTVSPMWVQCSDFTEGKQASRFFRHTLKGVAHHIKQELMALISNHGETRRLVHFVDARPMMPLYQPMVESQHLAYLPSQQPFPQQHMPTDDHLLIQSSGFMNPSSLYWSGQSVTEPIVPELYMN